MKASLTRGKSFLGVLLYVFDAEKEKREDVIREINTLDRKEFPNIGELNGYTRHAVFPVPDSGKHRYFSGNRLHNMSERRLVRASEQSKNADSVLQNLSLDHGREADTVRRESEYPAAAESAGNISTGGRGRSGSRDSLAGRPGIPGRLDRSEKRPEVVGGNMGRGELDPRQLSKDFAAIRRLRKDIDKAVWHCSLALPEGERADSAKWDEIARDMMLEMGFDPDLHQYVVVRHQDTKHDHVHLVANRIGMDGSVWLGRKDVFKAIEATQALELKHGLVLTPGLGEPAEKKRLSKKETEMALRTGNEPPRMQLQLLVDEAVQGKPTVVQFAEFLESRGVTVRANLASTGTMNGFSFEIEGVAFSGSQLGAGYKWASLQKKGVSYDQERDGASLSRFKKPESERVGGASRGPASDPAIEPGRDAGDAERRAGDTGQVPGIDGTADGDDGRSDGRNNAHPAADGRVQIDATGRSDRPGEPSRDGDSGPRPRDSRDRSGAGEAEPRAGRPIGADEGKRDGDYGQSGPGSIGAPGTNGGPGGEGREGRAGTDSQPAVSVAPAGDTGGVRTGSTDWRARFKQASAAKRRASELGAVHGVTEQVQQGRPGIAESDIRSAREVNPTDYLESCGFQCRSTRGGREISVRKGGDEIYRITQKDDGHWVACDIIETGIGDNIALVAEIEGSGIKFPAAVQRLIGTLMPGQVRAFTPKPKPVKPFAMPPQQPVDRKRGQEYLKERGIDQQTLIEAEKAGFLRYTDKAVLFVGRDPLGKEMTANRRATEKDDPVQKREISGSDKRFIAVLEGTGTVAYVVDGAVDALALHTMAKRHGIPTPTVYVTGGVGNRSWLDRESMQAKLRQHSEVRIAGENEKNSVVQERADEARNETKERIEAITGKAVTISTPGAPYKDVAELNAAEAAKERAAVAESERAVQAAQAIKGEQARRIAEVQRKKGLNDLVPSVLGYATSNALKQAGGDPDKVDWQAVEDAATHHLLVKYGRSPEGIAKGIIEHSPGRADPATHDQVRQHIAEVAPAMQQDRNVPDIDDQERVIVR